MFVKVSVSIVLFNRILWIEGRIKYANGGDESGETDDELHKVIKIDSEE